MEDFTHPPRFPEEDDFSTHRVVSASAGAWAVSLIALALMLLAGAAVLG